MVTKIVYDYSGREMVKVSTEKHGYITISLFGYNTHLGKTEAQKLIRLLQEALKEKFDRRKF